MASFLQLFGEKLQSASGLVDTSEVLSGKIVGIYFSAHWCPPCRGFTPKLAEAYTGHLKAKGFEIVFVSSDEDDASFKEYFGSMPWLALPYEEREKKAALSKKFKVKGIPTFVILDKDGSLITSDGRSAVARDAVGEDFPWRPKPVKELLGDDFIGAGGKPLDKAAIEGKVLGLYFSAHWCPPCKFFTPQLAEWYTNVSPKLPNFEVVFVSSDKTQEDFDGYFKEMPWIAVPFSDRKRKDALSEHFEVSGIPTLVLIDQAGNVITKNGRAIPGSDPEGTQFPWLPKPVKDVAQDTEDLQENPSLVVFMDAADEEARRKVEAALEPLAKQYAEKAKEGEDPLLFFIGGPSAAGILGRLRHLAKLPILKHSHPLVERPERENWRCDGCGGGEDGALSFNCKDCDFDFCVDCNAKAVDASGPPVGAIFNFGEGAYYVASGVDFTSTESVRDVAEKFHKGLVECASFE